MKARAFRTLRERPEQLLAQRVAASAERVAPACRHFGACGGCQMQDLPYAAQLAVKAAMLRDLLESCGLAQLPEIAVHSAEPYEYRNRARLRIAGGQVGYNRHASHDFLPVEECPIVSPLLWRTVDILRSEAQRGTIPLPADASSVELFVNSDETALQLALQLNTTVSTVSRDAPAAFRALAEALHAAVPQLAGAGLLVSAPPDAALPRRVAETRLIEIARWGEAKLLYTVEGRAYAITRNAFFQVNRFLTGQMVRTVLGKRRGAIAYDLFAGAGLFSVPLADRFDEVIAVEIGEPAASDLHAQLRQCGPTHRAVRSTSLAFLEAQNRSCAPRPELIVLDPPRAGLGPAMVQALIARGPREIVYVSCDAGTFASDARPLIESGYTLAELHLLDLFPQTFHTETIALFRR